LHNHEDARDENILFTPKGWRIIDWQYARFVAPKADWLLEHLAAYYIAKAPPDARDPLQDTWLTELYNRSGIALDGDSFRSRVAKLLAGHQGTRARLALRPA
jgi:hypothetical protein